MKPIIRVHDLSKEYRIRTIRASKENRLPAALGPKLPFKWRQNGGRLGFESIWALKNVSFEVEPGEVVGIIGRNGAGKSTLLKILSRVTEPTGGRIELYGRIGSLLEVGTGFHPELTGRENVFLNGAILGMPRVEIQRKFDEIVAFSEIERFIDTPVKWYSSGMYLRLAFAVSAHLEPEILMLDEVLTVGDAAFQRKCFNKMQDLRKDGRTILFVSHSMQAVMRLCRRLIYLSEGQIEADGPAQRIASDYLKSRLKKCRHRTWPDASTAPGNHIVRLRSARIRNDAGETKDIVEIREPVGIEIEFEVLEGGHLLVPNFPFYTEEGLCMFHVLDTDPEWKKRPRPKGTYLTTVWIPGNFLSEGTILVGLAISTLNPVTVHFYEQEALAFEVVEGQGGGSARGDYEGSYPGIIRPILDWTTKYISNESVTAPAPN
jgi:lipopolysaccharide transport system ATP-binding protein